MQSSLTWKDQHGFVGGSVNEEKMAAANNQPDFVRYYLQFPPVTRTYLTTVVIVTICLQFNLINRYTLYTSFLGSFLRFFDAGWGMWFLMTLVTRIEPDFG